MIKLRNIRRKNNIISCIILPEDATSFGSLVVDVSKHSIVDYDLPDGYKWCVNHVHHAAEALYRMASMDIITTEKNVTWG